MGFPGLVISGILQGSERVRSNKSKQSQTASEWLLSSKMKQQWIGVGAFVLEHKIAIP